MNRLPKNPNPFNITGCYIAGGAIHSIATGKEINDYDIYPKSLEDFGNILHSLIDEDGCYIMHISDRAITMKSNTLKNNNYERLVVQVMFFDWFPTSEKIFDYFDFTICMAAFDCDTEQYHFHPDFYPDIATKTIRFNKNSKFPISSMFRVEKYKNKGYHIGKAEHLKIALSIANTGLPQSWEELEAQLGGTYGRQVSLSKLQSDSNETKDEIPYSFDSAMEMLSELNIDFSDPFLYEDETKYVDETADAIVNYFDKEQKEYMIIENKGVFVDKTIIGDTFS